MPVDFQEETPSSIDFVEESEPTMQLAPIAPARSPEELSARQAAGQAALGTAPRGEPIIQSPFSTGLPIPRLPGVEEKPATWPEIAVAMLQPGTSAAMRMVGPNVPAQIGRKGLNVVPETFDFLLSPGGMLTAGISGLGAWASKLVAAGFSLDMLKSLYEQGKETLPNWGKLTDEQKAGALAEMAKTAGFAAATGFHAARPRVKPVPPILPKEEIPVEAPKVEAAPEPAAVEAAQPEKVYAPQERKVEEGVQPERVGTDAQRIPAETGVSDSLQPTAEKPGGEGTVSPPEKAAEVLLKEPPAAEPAAEPPTGFSAIEREDGGVLVSARNPQEEIGWAIVKNLGDGVFELNEVRVKESYRKKGVGTSLYMQAAEQVAKKGGKLYTSPELTGEGKTLVDSLSKKGLTGDRERIKGAFRQEIKATAQERKAGVAPSEVRPLAPVSAAPERGAPKPESKYIPSDFIRDRNFLLAEKERILQDIDDWRSGKHATPGQPATGKNYQLTMRDEVQRLNERLSEVNTFLKDLPQQGKQPWEMTQKEWLTPDNWDLSPAEKTIGRKFYGSSADKQVAIAYHKFDVVEKAIQEGKPVPPEVLKDYPDLQKPQPPAAPTTTAEGEGKAQAKVTQVAKTEGKRSAKEIKAELVQRLEEALKKAPSEAELRERMRTAPLAKIKDKTSWYTTVEIPEDGTFTVFNTKEAISSTLARAKRISLSETPPKPAIDRTRPELKEQAESASKAYGSPEDAYRSVSRQIDGLREGGPPDTAAERESWNNQITSALALKDEIYHLTKAGQLADKAEAIRDRLASYREGAKSFEDAIAKIERIKRKTAAHKERLEDLKERYAQNQKFLEENERNAEQWEQQSAREKAALEAKQPPPAAPAEGGIVGMGGAVPSEFPATGAGADVYGVAARVREERAKAGQVAPIPPGIGTSAEASVERGRQLIEQGAIPESSMAAFEATKKISADDMAVARAHGEQLAEAGRRIEEKFGTDSPEYRMAFEALSNWDRRSKVMQTEWHKMGMGQQGETEIDTGTFTGLQRAFKQATDKEFSPEQAESAKKTAARVKAAQDAAEVAKQKLYTELDKPLEPAIDPKIAGIADRIIAYLDKSASEALARIKARRAEGRAFSGGIDPEELQDYVIYGASKLARGVLKSEWMRTMVNDIGDYITPHLDTILAASEAMAQKLALEAAGPKQAKAVRKAMATPKVPAAPTTEVTQKVLETVKPGADFTPQQAKTLWNYARKQYIDKGETDFDEVRNKVATDLGMKVDDVTRGLASPKSARKMTNEMWQKQQEARRVVQQARQWLRETELPWYRKAINAVPRMMFSLKVGFHGTVALGTHAPMVAFQPRFWNVYIRDFGKMYHLVGSPAYYEMQVQDLMRRPNYVTARRAGLVNDPFQYEEFAIGETRQAFNERFPKLADSWGKVTRMGNRGYSILKIIRQDMFDQMWNKLPETTKTPEVAAALADHLNHATGVVRGKAPPGTNIALFAPRLEASRIMWLAGDPLRAAETFAKWTKATPAEKMFAINQVKEKAWVFGTMMSALALNQGFLIAAGSDQKINGIPEFLGGGGFNPMRGDFLKFKIAGMRMIYGSPVITMARLPLRIWVGLKNEGKLNKIIHEDENLYKIIGDYARSQASPFAGTIADLAFGRDYQQRPLPRAGFGFLPERNYIPKRLREEGITSAYTWPEFWSQQLAPIPFQEALKEVWGKGLGMTDEQIKQTGMAFATLMFMTATGARLTEDVQSRPLLSLP